ncbi:hypothetical protein DID77_00575 [Candidatus Marinamargulisbacteria bacterium SCGC AG-439-L15]|nr:hypothetical protein DID77_00575 [Candidatus Marinamargulisbacteria bacterium SCGC AG-439-L15]
MSIGNCFDNCFGNYFNRNQSTHTEERSLLPRENTPLIPGHTASEIPSLAYNIESRLQPNHSKLFKEVLSVAILDQETGQILDTTQAKIRISSTQYDKETVQREISELQNVLTQSSDALQNYQKNPKSGYPSNLTLSSCDQEHYKTSIQVKQSLIKRYFSKREGQEDISQIHIICIQIDPKRTNIESALSIQLVKETTQNGNSSIALYSVKEKGYYTFKNYTKIDINTESLSSLDQLFQLK